MFKKYSILGIKTASVVNAGYNVWGLTDDCREFSEGKSSKSGGKCVYSAISTAIGIGVSVFESVKFVGSIIETGLIYTNGAFKRDIEDSLSGRFGTEVRHIADWHGITLDHVTERDNAEPVPVFGMTLHGRDVHFSVTSGENNSTRMRLSNGPGPDTESNRRLRRRGARFNDVIFEKGGLDFEVASDPNHDNNNKLQFNPTSQVDFDWIYKQVECYMALEQFGTFISGNPVDIAGRLNSIGGIHFQVTNTLEKRTMAAGKIAPFKEGKKSMISKMNINEPAPANDVCTKK